MTKKEITKRLNALSKIDRKKVVKPDNSLDIPAFNSLPEVTALINDFKTAGITKDDLCRRGFIAASLILQF
jgi:hypothetical protein